MRCYVLIVILSVCALTSVKAQTYSVNYDKETVSAMVASYNTEAATERYYEDQIAKIRGHYQAAEVAAAGIFTSKFLDRQALTNMGLWTSSTENYYYRRIYHMVSAKIMPKIWDVANMMLEHPENALYWGSYLYKVCDETKSLCYQFESIVTNSQLSFKDIAFLEINQQLASILKLSELADIDWKGLLENLANVPSRFSKESLQADIDNLYNMGVSLATGGWNNLVNTILGNNNFNGNIVQKFFSVWEMADHVYGLYEDITTDTGNTLLRLIGGREGINHLFNLSNYNATAWLTDYAREGFGQYYAQRWYIYRVDAGSVSLCDYTPPKDKNSILYGKTWYRINTTDPSYYPTDTQFDAALSNSESDAGWSRTRVQQLNNANDGFSYSINYWSNSYILSRTKSGQYAKAYAFDIHVTKSWYKKEVKYEDVFDSYTMNLATFKATMNARLRDYNDNEDGYTYYLASDTKHYYQSTDAQKMEGCETATISVTCHDGTKLGEGSTQYKCDNCGGSVTNHTKQCSMATSVTETNVNTSEIDAKIADTESQIAMLQSQIEALETENAALIRMISESSVTDAAKYRQQYNANKDHIISLKTEKTNLEKALSQYRQARKEMLNGEQTQTDDYYRIPAIMQDWKSIYNLNWNGEGSWNGNTFVRTATMPNMQGNITFKATISIARKPKYVLGIKVHRAIVQISWELTTEYSDSQVMAVLNFDKDKSDADKAAEVNAKVSEIAREYPDCQVSVEYAGSESVESEDTDDTYHLLWTSDRLEIARDIDSRLTKIYADLVSLEKMMTYKHSIIDMLMTAAPYIDDEEGRRLTTVEKCRKRWMRHAASSAHSDSYNGKYDDDDED